MPRSPARTSSWSSTSSTRTVASAHDGSTASTRQPSGHRARPCSRPPSASARARMPTQPGALGGLGRRGAVAVDHHGGGAVADDEPAR